MLNTAVELQLYSVFKFFKALKADFLCTRLAAIVYHPWTHFDKDKSGILVRETAIDGPFQRVAPGKLQRARLYNAHNPLCC